MDNKERQITDEAQKQYEEIKEGFKGFSKIDSVPDENVNIEESGLPTYDYTQNAERIDAAMERLYGPVIDETARVGKNKTQAKKKRKK